MSISIIICSYNNHEQLQKTLAAMECCDAPQNVSIEVILVNNASRDDTYKLKKHSSKKFIFRYIEEHNKGKSNALNTGIRLANGDLIIFTDDDVRPSTEWITTYWKAYEKHGDRYIFGGNVKSIYENECFNKCILKYAPYSVSGLDHGDIERILEDKEYFIGANYAIPKSTIKITSGFKTNIGLNPKNIIPSVGEETEMQMSLQSKGYKRIHLPNAWIGHFVPSNKTRMTHTLKRRLAYGIYKTNVEDVTTPKEKKIPISTLTTSLIKNIAWTLRHINNKDASIQRAHEIAYTIGNIIGRLY